MPGGMYGQTGQHGDIDKATPVWKGGVAVAFGDLIYRATSGTYSGYDVPVALFDWDTDLATTLAAIRPKIRGYSEAQRSATFDIADGGIGAGMIAETGEFVKPCAALGAAAQPGAYVTIAKQTGDALENKKVAITTTEAAAIGIVTRDAAVGATFLYFKLLEQPLIKGIAA